MFTSSSHRSCSVRKGVLRKFAKFTEKHLCQSLFFKEVAGLRSAIFFKKRLWHSCFLVNFAKFLRTPFYETPPDDCFWMLPLFSPHSVLLRVWYDKSCTLVRQSGCRYFYVLEINSPAYIWEKCYLLILGYITAIYVILPHI